MKKSYTMWSFITLMLIAGSYATPLSSSPHLVPPGDNPEPEETNPSQNKPRIKRQYYVCPPEFERVSSYCYYFSRQQATWMDAHHECRDRRSELAVLATAAEDRKLRGQLNRSVKPLEWWIAGIYDWEQMKWKWVSGKKFEYHGFSRMGPENKEKLRWHCSIMDPTMKYKWSARSCVLGKHYICQKPVMKVNKKKLERLRKKYNNTLNEIPAPIYEKNYKPYKPKKHENHANGHSKHNLKQYIPNGVNVHHDQNNLNNAFGRRNNTEITRNTKKQRRNKNREERKKKRKNKNRNLELHVRNGNGTEVSGNIYAFPDDSRRNRKRNRRNKSKENNSLENATYSQEELSKNKKKLWSNENTSMEETTSKNTYVTNTLSPLHPRIIVEEHDFMDLHPNFNKNN